MIYGIFLGGGDEQYKYNGVFLAEMEWAKPWWKQTSLKSL